MTGPELIEEIEASGGVLALSGDRVRYELPGRVASLVELLREHREEVLRVLREREQPTRCYVHGGKATWWFSPDRYWVCEGCHPAPVATALTGTTQSRPPQMPEGVRLLCWEIKRPPVAIETWSIVNDVPLFVGTKRPPVAIETWSIVNDVPLFVGTTLKQLESALKGDCLGAGNWPVRTLVERLECAGVKVEVTR